MSYRPKVVKCKMNFKDITDEEIMDKCALQSEMETVKKFYKKLDGTVLFLALWDYDHHECYHLYGCGHEIENTMMEAIFILEDGCGMYHDFEEFKNDWISGEYDSGGSIVFDRKFAEELEVFCDEQKD